MIFLKVYGTSAAPLVQAAAKVCVSVRCASYIYITSTFYKWIRTLFLLKTHYLLLHSSPETNCFVHALQLVFYLIFATGRICNRSHVRPNRKWENVHDVQHLQTSCRRYFQGTPLSRRFKEFVLKSFLHLKRGIQKKRRAHAVYLHIDYQRERCNCRY